MKSKIISASLALHSHEHHKKTYKMVSKTKLFLVFAITALFVCNSNAQNQLISEMKTESFNNYYGRHYGAAPNTTITEQKYNYNKNNQVTDITVWTTTPKGRKLSSKTTYTYNEKGEYISVVYEGLDYNTKEFVVQSLTEYTYNDDRMESMISKSRDYNSQELHNSYKYIYDYDASGMASTVQYNWNRSTGVWVEVIVKDHDKYIYDEWGYDYLDSREGDNFQSYKTEQELNDDGTIKSTTYLNYHFRSKTWQYTSRTNYLYDERGLNKGTISEVWNQFCESWVNNSKSLTTYNESTQPIVNEYHTWDPVTKNWVLTSRTTSTYIEPNLIIELEELEQINIYPNPSTGKVIIQFDEPLNEDLNYEVYNSLGQTVQEGNIPAEEVEIKLDITSEPAGNYFLKLDSGQKVITKKFTIQR